MDSPRLRKHLIGAASGEFLLSQLTLFLRQLSPNFHSVRNTITSCSLRINTRFVDPSWWILCQKVNWIVAIYCFELDEVLSLFSVRWRPLVWIVSRPTWALNVWLLSIALEELVSVYYFCFYQFGGSRDVPEVDRYFLGVLWVYLRHWGVSLVLTFQLGC